jgi:hypothetical protein
MNCDSQLDRVSVLAFTLASLDPKGAGGSAVKYAATQRAGLR